MAPSPTTAAATADPYERPIARLVYAPGGTLLDAEPSGYPDAPDPLPVLPTAGPAPVNGQIVTLLAPNSDLAYRALIERRPGGVVIVTAAPLSDVEEAIARVVRAAALAAGVTLAATALASWRLIRVGLRPVDRMVDTAAAIAAGDLGRRVPDANLRTELGRLGAALNEVLGQIERSAAARAASEARLRRFVADAAHELRTPLTSLRSYAELYRQGGLPTPAAVSRVMGRIESEAGRMRRLIEDLLLLARLDQQRALEWEPVDLVALAHEAALDFAAVAPDRLLATELDAEAVVLGVRVRLRQVFNNLLTNARTHSPAAAPVRLVVRCHGQDAELVVADVGPGIPPQAQERVFERFWRGDPGRTRQRGGTGLGLWPSSPRSWRRPVARSPSPASRAKAPSSPSVSPGPLGAIRASRGPGGRRPRCCRRADRGSGPDRRPRLLNRRANEVSFRASCSEGSRPTRRDRPLSRDASFVSMRRHWRAS